MQFSKHLLEKMGFKFFPDGEAVSGKFFIVHIFEIRGFTIDAATLNPKTKRIRGVTCRAVIGSDLNAISRKMTGDDFAEDQEKWLAEHKCTPPFLMIILGPTKIYESHPKYVNYTTEDIITYQGFDGAKADLNAQTDDVLPSLIFSLTMTFSSNESTIRFIPIDRLIYGKNRDGKNIKDVRITGSMSAYVSRKFENSDVSKNLDISLKKSSGVNVKVANFFKLALDEQDSLKKFLYFFLCLEIFIHKTYEKIDTQKIVTAMFIPPAHVPIFSGKFFAEQSGKLRSLMDRFVWCAMCSWTHLSDSDIKDFEYIKSIRDKIAHGSISTPPDVSVDVAEKLAIKLHSGR